MRPGPGWALVRLLRQPEKLPPPGGRAVTGPFGDDEHHAPEVAGDATIKAIVEAGSAGVPGLGGREFPDAEQPAEPIQRGRDMQAGVGIHAAGDDTCVFYDGHSRPFRG